MASNKYTLTPIIKPMDGKGYEVETENRVCVVTLCSK